MIGLGTGENQEIEETMIKHGEENQESGKYHPSGVGSESSSKESIWRSEEDRKNLTEE